METQLVTIDPAALFKAAEKTKTAGTEADKAFASLFAQITQSMENKSSVAALKPATLQSSQTYAVSSSGSEATTLSSPSGTPIARLEQALRQSGTPLERFEVSAEDRGQLEEVLVKSGYSRKQAQELLQRSSKKDGKISLGALFNLMSEYLPAQGTQILLNVEDKPLLVQILKDLGVSEKDIQEYMQSLPQKGNQLVVSGLPELLAKVSAKLESGELDGVQVDRSVLKDLLTRLGLSDKEVETLMSKAVDQKGNTDPKAVLALLQAAAEKQNDTMGQALKDLAAKLMVSSTSTEENSSDADRVRAQVIKILQQIEAGDKNQTTDLKAALKAALASAEDEGSESGLPFGQNKEGQGSLKDSGRQAQDGATREAINLVKKSQDASQVNLDKTAQEQTEKKAQTAEAKLTEAKAAATATTQKATGETAQTTTQANPVAGAARAATSLTQAAQAVQQKASLPAYVVRQVSEQMVQMVRQQMSSLRLTLKPPELGQLNLELSVKDGALQATLRTDTVLAKNTLEAGLEQLKQVLGQQGLKVERLEVLVNPDADQRQAQTENGGQNSSRQKNKGSIRQVEGAAQADDDEETPRQAARTELGASSVNLFA